MLKNITLLFLLSCTTSAFSLNPMYLELLEHKGVEFANLEHEALGNDVDLHLGDEKNITLENGLVVTYGDLIMLAGDMFGDERYPVSSCKDEDKKQCFLNQFNTLALPYNGHNACKNPLIQVPKIKAWLQTIDMELSLARENGINDWDYYNQNNIRMTKDLNQLTCGGSQVTKLFPFGAYIKLASVNFDHFQPDSLIAYQTGHDIALNMAIRAHELLASGELDQAKALLKQAYAINGFANHYLSDSFSAGHIRTPRRAIHKQLFVPDFVKVLVANLMHNEDNHYGLYVKSHNGLTWKAFGDGYLYSQEAYLQREIIRLALQASLDGIYFAYQSGIKPKNDATLDYVPMINHDIKNHHPLFMEINGRVFKRTKQNDVHSNQYQKHWSAIKSLLLAL